MIRLGKIEIVRERRRQLRDHSVEFVDLTGMFADEPRAVYSDFCCHVNAFGANLIADRVAAKVLSLDVSTATNTH